MLFRFKCFNWCLRPANETRQCCKGNFFWGKVATKHMRAVIKIMLRTIPMGQMLWTAEELQRFHQGSKKYVRIILSNWLIMKIITKSHFGRIIYHWHRYYSQMKAVKFATKGPASFTLHTTLMLIQVSWTSYIRAKIARTLPGRNILGFLCLHTGTH